LAQIHYVKVNTKPTDLYHRWSFTPINGISIFTKFLLKNNKRIPKLLKNIKNTRPKTLQDARDTALSAIAVVAPKENQHE